MAQTSFDFQAWDCEMVGKTPDYEKLYQQILQVLKESPTENIEFLWRLAYVTYQVSLNYVDEDLIKAKTQESLQHSEKALKLDDKHFQTNLWLAVAAGKLALIESDMQAKSKLVFNFVTDLQSCFIISLYFTIDAL